MPEDHIVGKLAACLVKRHVRWPTGRSRLGGAKSKIRDAVERSCPPHGYKRKRLEAVIAEIVRQREIRGKRSANRPYDWSEYTGPHKSVRLNTVYRRYFGNTTDLDIRQFRLQGENKVFLVTKYYECSWLDIVRSTGERVRVSVDPTRHSRSIIQAVMRMGCRRAETCLLEGGAIMADFGQLATVLYREDGREEHIQWPIEEEACS